MEKSMVHELNGLTTSQFLNNRSTFISTAYNEGDFQMRKSRIQNLPSYKKEDLSNRINFVVVFQAIQIERLSTEVQALRIALKDDQRQGYFVKNYEVQIRQLTQKYTQVQNDLNQYKEQNEKMNMICQKLYQQLESMKARFADIDPTIKQKFRLQKQRNRSLEQQLEKWRARYSALQVSKSRQMQDMRHMMESQRKSMIDKEIKQMTLKFMTQRQSLQKEIRRLRQNLDSKDSEAQRLSMRISQLQILNQQLRQYQGTIDQYQNKFAMISQQTMRLNDLLRRKQEQIDRLNSEQGNYKRKISDLERRLRQQQEGGQKAKMLQNQIRQLRGKNSRFEDQIRRHQQQLQRIPEFQKRIQHFSHETDKLKDALRQKVGENDQWKNRYQKIEYQFRDNKAKQEQKIPVLEKKINQLSNQNDRLSGQLKSRTGQIQNWKNRCNDFERQITRYVTIEQDKKNLQGQLNNHVRQINDLQGNIKQLQNQLRRLGEVQRELSNERSQKQQCRKEIDRLNNGIRNVSQKADNFERKCQNLQRQLKTFTQIQQQLRIHKQKQINFTKQIDRIHGIINEKIKQIQALKEVFQKFDSKLAQYQGMEKKLMQTVSKTQKIVQDLDQTRKQNGALQDKLISIQSQNRIVKNQVFNLAQQRQQLVKAINAKTQQAQQYKGQTMQLQSQVNQLRQKQAKLRQIQQKYRINENKLAQVERRLKSQINRSHELSDKFEQTTAQLMKIKKEGMMSPKFKQEFFELKVQSEKRQKQIRALQSRITIIEGIIKKLKQSLVKQHQVISTNSQKAANFQKRFNVTAEAMKKMFDLQAQIMRLNEQNLQLESKFRITNVQNQTLKQSRNVLGSYQSNRQIGSPYDNLAVASKRSDYASQYSINSVSPKKAQGGAQIQNIKPSSVAPSYGSSKNMMGTVSNENYNYNFASSSGNSNYNQGSGLKNTFDSGKVNYNNYNNDGYTSGFSYTTNSYATSGGVGGITGVGGAGGAGGAGLNGVSAMNMGSGVGGFNSYSSNTYLNSMGGKGTGFSPEMNDSYNYEYTKVTTTGGGKSQPYINLQSFSKKTQNSNTISNTTMNTNFNTNPNMLISNVKPATSPLQFRTTTFKGDF